MTHRTGLIDAYRHLRVAGMGRLQALFHTPIFYATMYRHAVEMAEWMGDFDE